MYVCVWANSQTSGQELKYFIFFSLEQTFPSASTNLWLGYNFGAGLYPKKDFKMLKNLGNKAYKCLEERSGST